MPIVLANDASWEGWGIALCTENGPLVVRHAAHVGRTAWRYDTLRTTLEGLEGLVEGDRPRIVVETAQAVYRRGNQAATAQGLGQLSGALLLWGTRPGVLPYPWGVTPETWRAWWTPTRAAKRARWKAWAVRTVQALGWGSHLDPYPWEGEDGGACADVAEAILLGVGAARHDGDAPAGPRRWSRL